MCSYFVLHVINGFWGTVSRLPTSLKGLLIGLIYILLLLDPLQNILLKLKVLALYYVGICPVMEFIKAISVINNHEITTSSERGLKSTLIWVLEL